MPFRELFPRAFQVPDGFEKRALTLGNPRENLMRHTLSGGVALLLGKEQRFPRDEGRLLDVRFQQPPGSGRELINEGAAKKPTRGGTLAMLIV